MNCVVNCVGHNRDDKRHFVCSCFELELINLTSVYKKITELSIIWAGF